MVFEAEKFLRYLSVRILYSKDTQVFDPLLISSGHKRVQLLFVVFTVHFPQFHMPPFSPLRLVQIVSNGKDLIACWRK